MAAELAHKFGADKNVRVLGQTLEDWQRAVRIDEYDGIVLVNVLEHIRDDHYCRPGVFSQLETWRSSYDFCAGDAGPYIASSTTPTATIAGIRGETCRNASQVPASRSKSFISSILPVFSPGGY